MNKELFLFLHDTSWSSLPFIFCLTLDGFIIDGKKKKKKEGRGEERTSSIANQEEQDKRQKQQNF